MKKQCRKERKYPQMHTTKNGTKTKVCRKSCEKTVSKRAQVPADAHHKKRHKKKQHNKNNNKKKATKQHPRGQQPLTIAIKAQPNKESKEEVSQSQRKCHHTKYALVQVLLFTVAVELVAVAGVATCPIGTTGAQRRRWSLVALQGVHHGAFASGLLCCFLSLEIDRQTLHNAFICAFHQPQCMYQLQCTHYKLNCTKQTTMYVHFNALTTTAQTNNRPQCPIQCTHYNCTNKPQCMFQCTHYNCTHKQPTTMHVIQFNALTTTAQTACG